jgi:CRISPR-associated protein Cmr3
VSSYLKILPHDPLIARDGRPFNAGSRMHSVDWLFPSVLAGSLRSLLGKNAGGGFPPSVVRELRDVSVAGPFLVREREGGEDEMFFPTPKDLVMQDAPVAKALPLRPRKPDHGGCDLPEGMLPALLGEGENVAAKQTSATPQFFSQSLMTRWLADGKGDSLEIPDGWGNGSSTLYTTVEKDMRVHVEIQPASGAAEPERLFQTVGLAFPERFHLVARAESGNGFAASLGSLDCLHPLGGERRLAHWKTTKSGGWTVPSAVMDAVKAEPKRLRMVLATPAVFEKGWLPGWLAGSFRGKPHGAKIQLRLVGACVDRWIPVSGWSLEPLSSTGKPGPKAIKRLPPGGSVYFFEVESGDAEEFVSKFWLSAVSDEEQDRKDGFGLALWGPWAE